MRKIHIVSSKEPNGATWLINCLLELGIKTYRSTYQNGTWILNNDGSYSLNSQDNILKKWLPALTKQEKFNFRSDIEVEWSHEWTKPMHKNHQVIYFIRDPRDTIYSRYKRENHNISFEEFINIPDSDTLLNKIDNWILFNLFWLKFENILVCRFEDYKTDPNKLLKSILDYIDFETEAGNLHKAIENSTFEKARESERLYLLNNPGDTETVIRSGKAGEWTLMQGDVKKVLSLIEFKTKPLLKELGYDYEESNNIVQFSLNENDLNIINEDFYTSLFYNLNDVLLKNKWDYNLTKDYSPIFNLILKMEYYKTNYNPTYMHELCSIYSLSKKNVQSFAIELSKSNFNSQSADNVGNHVHSPDDLYFIRLFLRNYAKSKVFWHELKLFSSSNSGLISKIFFGFLSNKIKLRRN